MKGTTGSEIEMDIFSVGWVVDGKQMQMRSKRLYCTLLGLLIGTRLSDHEKLNTTSTASYHDNPAMR